MGQPAARITDMHTCPMVTGTVPHVGGPIVLGSFTVFTGDLPQARVGDMLICMGPPDVIAMGSSGVFVNDMPAARLGDQTAHGGVVVVGLPTVLIGETGGGGGGGAAGAPGMAEHASDSSDATPVVMAFTQALAQAQALIQAAMSGAPFCEACFAAAVTNMQNAIASAL
jgi:uncharacterized Zn-binding protein involved in type VI secretion